MRTQVKRPNAVQFPCSFGPIFGGFEGFVVQQNPFGRCHPIKVNQA